ncbi:AfsR/SARP family transcriptional regulator, partial [Amnibacterium endophyticum]
MDGARAEVLGPVRTAVAGEVRPVAGALPRRLLVALALAGGTGRSAEGLVDDVWADDAPRSPRAALQMLVSRVRAAAGEGLVLSTPAGYRLAGSDQGGGQAGL